MNRKGAVPSAITDFIGYGVFAFMIVIFFFLFKLPAVAPHQIQTKEFGEIQSQQWLTNYLRVPVEFNDQTITMADYLILASDFKGSAYDRLQAFLKSKQVLDDYVSQTKGCYNFEMYDAHGTTLLSFGGGQGGCTRIPTEYKSLTLPKPNGELLSLRLFTETGILQK